jgi:membrane dipeptidase
LSPQYREDFTTNVQKAACARHRRDQEYEDGYLFAPDLNTPRRFEVLPGLLSTRGHADGRIEKILGGNLQRVFESAW